MSNGHITPRNLLAAAQAFFRLIRNPNEFANFQAVEESLLALASPRYLERVAASYRRSPELGPMLRDRYLGTTPDVSVLMELPAGTFGRAFARFITDNNLSVDYYPHAEPTDDLAYFKARMLQMHDIWHVLIGAAPDLPGELQIIGFTIGQMERTLRRELAVAFLYMMTVAYLVNSVVNPAWRLSDAWAHFTRGRRAGLASAPLFNVAWEERWHKPLDSVRARARIALPGVPPRRLLSVARA